MRGIGEEDDCNAVVRLVVGSLEASLYRGSWSGRY
jgi:hypothetical protein